MEIDKGRQRERGEGEREKGEDSETKTEINKEHFLHTREPWRRSLCSTAKQRPALVCR